MKDLFLIFTLLSLLCFTSSLLDTEQMTKLNEMFQKTKLIFERLKSEQNKNEERRLMIEHVQWKIRQTWDLLRIQEEKQAEL
ncbi:hypothetical protein CHARACLAT_019110 [Characodon lateralis]|uniref:Uncharacterized protein n=1 Tax=Characodon lateralis TaxID=208331 RepID=A0ABU7EAY3_9TELE|nr:hypothetical protein [Characodon lateralis]